MTMRDHRNGTSSTKPNTFKAIPGVIGEGETHEEKNARDGA